MTQSHTQESPAMDAETKAALEQMHEEQTTNAATKKNQENAASMMLALDAIRKKRIEFDAGIKLTAQSVLHGLIDDVYGTCVTFYTAATKSAKLVAIASMKEELQKRGTKPKENARVLPMMIQLTFGTDDRRANRYAQVITKGISKNVLPGKLAGFITDAGGIENVITKDPNAPKVTKGFSAEQIQEEIKSLEDVQYLKLSLPYEELDGKYLKGNNAVLLATKKPGGKFAITAFMDEVTEDKCPIYTAFMNNLARKSLKAKEDAHASQQGTQQVQTKEKKKAKETA